MASGAADPGQIVGDLTMALGLPDTASSEEIVRALAALLAELDAADAAPLERDPLGQPADPPPHLASQGHLAPAGSYAPTDGERAAMTGMNDAEASRFLKARAYRAGEAATLVAIKSANRSRREAWGAGRLRGDEAKKR